MSRKKKPIKPSPYWAEQQEKLLKQVRPGGLVTPLGAPNPPEDGAHLPPELNHITRRMTAEQLYSIDPKDKEAADNFIAQIQVLAVAGVQGYPITEEWYEARGNGNGAMDKR